VDHQATAAGVPTPSSSRSWSTVSHSSLVSLA
jgi:hypothetical protein